MTQLVIFLTYRKIKLSIFYTIKQLASKNYSIVAF